MVKTKMIDKKLDMLIDHFEFIEEDMIYKIKIDETCSRYDNAILS